MEQRPYGTICPRYQQEVNGTCKNCVLLSSTLRDKKTGIKISVCKQ